MPILSKALATMMYYDSDHDDEYETFDVFHPLVFGPREHFALRTDDQVAYGRLVAAGAGIGFVARYNLAHWPGVVPILPMLKVPTLPCWLAVHREIRGNPLVRRVYDFLAQALPPALAA